MTPSITVKVDTIEHHYDNFDDVVHDVGSFIYAFYDDLNMKMENYGNKFVIIKQKKVIHTFESKHTDWCIIFKRALGQYFKIKLDNELSILSASQCPNYISVSTRVRQQIQMTMIRTYKYLNIETIY